MIVPGILLWLCLSLLDWVILVPVGWLVVRRLSSTGQYHAVESTRYADKRVLLQWTPRWAWIWGNEEDGVDGLRGGRPDPAYWQTYHDQISWWQETASLTQPKRMVAWYLRNSTNNLRYVKPYAVAVDPSRIKVRGTAATTTDTGWFFVTQGIFFSLYLGGYKWFGKTRMLWIGWRLTPADAKPAATPDYRAGLAGTVFHPPWTTL